MWYERVAAPDARRELAVVVPLSALTDPSAGSAPAGHRIAVSAVCRCGMGRRATRRSIGNGTPAPDPCGWRWRPSTCRPLYRPCGRYP